MDKTYYVYLMASQPYGTLYLGITSNLARRVYEHKNGLLIGFTKQYGVTQLVWYENYPSPDAAIAAEKKYKKWRRTWKLDMVQKFNPQWRDLADDLNK